MYFESFSELFYMDGHGPFVWAAYFITLTAVALMLILPRRRQRKLLQQLAGEIRRQQGDASASSGES
ncbi:MAG: heme exporter protein CcmD [Halioglobus sp.]